MSLTAGRQLLLSGTVAGYQIERSLRFNSSDSGFCSRTPASAGNRKTWTWAGWVKRSTLSASTRYALFGSADAPGTSYTIIEFYNDTIRLLDTNSGGTTEARVTAAVYRDTSAWMHILLAYDTTQATAANRIKLYVNGSELTVFTTSSNPSQNSDAYLNQAVPHAVGAATLAGTPSTFFDGYLADIHFIDGQALTPTSFGEFDVNNVWQPKAYTGSYGTNGFRLDFSDNSAATATTLGKDRAGSNNWTPNNLSVTAGAGNDSLVDSPTNYGTDTGAGNEVRGNYCTWNPLLRGQTGTPVYSNGNLDASATGNWAAVGGTVGIESGKWYWETTVTAIGSSNQSCIGLLQTVPPFYLGFSSGSWGYFSDGRKFAAGSGVAYGSTYGLNDVIGVAFDRDNGTLVFYKNGVSQGTAYTGLTSGVYFPATSHVDSSTSATNFGQRPFAYTAPSGFKALCTANLPTPTIANPATAMDVALYTGTGATLTPTSTLGFSPDLVWIKSRSAATDNTLYDSVRGAQARLESNTTDAEVTSDNGLTAFNSNGFTLGTLAQVNTNAATYAGWAWDAGTSTVTNTQGSITSSVRANTAAGFSVVTWTGSNTASTIGHGLGVAPAFIITKSRNNAIDWQCYHIALGKDKTIAFNSTAAAATVTNYWGSAEPTSTVFGTRNASGDYNNTGNMLAYCFAPVAGYSSFGSYTGNGSADGPFVWCGFRPRWVLIKASSAVSFGSWRLFDTARDTYNVCGNQLIPNLADAEYGPGATGTAIDILSNGFKLRSNFDGWNGSGSTYVWAAFAESPFAYSRAR